ncbi:twin-arginine translocase subunit TatC [Kroppenstedtia pulmonis]|uniref:Sec-independent protein translocase protein TatC n=1 Tax=Kroppenstedtia pulmonis TaxID=1380685 RepID=A0A7D3XP73_9BACL|nr:twin-arginine translocase subunit TatC [Kroppenstedtia pulmonis]QKG85409.1 twin-arginine translocase subunit TatC [Kroppenstedtia pulmonis]
MSEEDKYWMEHLTELRRRLIWVLITFVLTLVIGFLFAKPMIDFLKTDLLDGTLGRTMELNIFSPGEALSIFMQFAFVVAFTITLPVALFQLWRFVQPGLTSSEQKATLTYIPFAVVLFLIGLFFGYYWIFPFLLQFMSKLTTTLGATETYGMYEFFRFMFRIVLPIAFLFELPVLIMFLTRIRLLRPDLLRKGRRYAYLGMVILAALVTPPDLISNILVSIPLIFLYEVSILLSTRVYHKMIREEAAREASWQEQE